MSLDVACSTDLEVVWGAAMSEMAGIRTRGSQSSYMVRGPDEIAPYIYASLHGPLNLIPALGT